MRVRTKLLWFFNTREILAIINVVIDKQNNENEAVLTRNFTVRPTVMLFAVMFRYVILNLLLPSVIKLSLWTCSSSLFNNFACILMRQRWDAFDLSGLDCNNHKETV